MKTGVTLIISGTLAWLWVLSGIQIAHWSQWVAAGVVLFLFVAPGIQVWMDEVTTRNIQRRFRALNSPKEP
jgi:hypothetical protein